MLGALSRKPWCLWVGETGSRSGPDREQIMLSMQRSTPVSRPRCTRGSLRIQAFGDSHSTGMFKEGQRVKVVKPVMLYSVPKHPEGLVIEGMQGEVAKDVSTFKGKILSASLPYLVKFNADLNGAAVKFQAHLVSGVRNRSGRSATGTIAWLTPTCCMPLRRPRMK